MSQTLPGLLPAPATLDRLAAAACHASLVIGVPIVVPLVVLGFYALVRTEAPYPRNQAAQALLYHLLISAISGAFLAVSIALGVGGFLSLGLQLLHGADPSTLTLPSSVGMPLLALLASLLVMTWGGIVSLIATYRTLQGAPYQVPVVGRWLS